MPKVTVKLFATLQKFLPQGTKGRSASIEAADGATVSDVLTGLGVPQGSAAVITVNGEQAAWDTPLGDGDSLTVFPPVVGG